MPMNDESSEFEMIILLMGFLFASFLRKDVVYRWAREDSPEERAREARAWSVRQPIQIYKQPNPAHPGNRRR